MRISICRKTKLFMINYQVILCYQINIFGFQDGSKADLLAILFFCLVDTYFQVIINILSLYFYEKIVNFVLVHRLFFILMKLIRLQKNIHYYHLN